MRQFRKLTSLLCAVALLIAAMCLPAMAETSAIFAGGSGGPLADCHGGAADCICRQHQ